MKKCMMFIIAMMVVCGLAFAMGSTSAKEKAYGDCLVNVPKLCGGSKSVNWSDPVEAKKFTDCTAPKYAECYRIYKQGV